MFEPRTVVIGTQRLSERPEGEVGALLRAAVDAGVHWLDVADVYGPTPGAAERQVAHVAGQLRVITKGGLVRGGRRWRPDGRASHLREAARASQRRLGGRPLDLYLLHLPDPRVPWVTSVRALAKLQEQEVARAVGLSNVTVGQLRAAQEICEIACVQVPFSPFDPSSVRSGILEHCLAEGIPVLAHRPLGGADRVARLARDKSLTTLAAARGVSPAELVLAWIRDLGLVPVPGPTREATLRSAVRSAAIGLDDEARRVLDAAFPIGARLRVPRAERAPHPDQPGDVRIIMGSPGAGKSTLVQSFVDRGYLRLNRDERGGTLARLVRALDEALSRGERQIVLDNTYPTRAQRYDVIEAAWDHGVPVRALWLDTPPGDCERNLVQRVLHVAGHLPGPEGLASPAEAAIVGPRALLRYRSQLEPPELGEGLAELEVVPFVRRPSQSAERALICDPRHLEPHASALAEAHAEGWRVLVIGWEPGADPEAWAREVQDECGFPVHAAVCPHPAGPPVCWCRKPWLGLVVALAWELGVDLDRSQVVVTTAADRTLARKLAVAVYSLS